MENIITTSGFFLITGTVIAYAFEFRRCLNTILKVDGPEFDSHSAHALLMQRAIITRMNANNEDFEKIHNFSRSWRISVKEYIAKHTDGISSADSKDNDKTLH